MCLSLLFVRYDNPWQKAALAKTWILVLVCGSRQRVGAEDFSLFSHVVFGTKSRVNAEQPSAIFAYWQIV